MTLLPSWCIFLSRHGWNNWTRPAGAILPADAGCQVRKQCELDRASRRMSGCWSKQRDLMRLWATEISPSILYSRVAEQSAVKNFGKESRNPGLPFLIEHAMPAMLRALIYFSSFWPSTLTLLYGF